MFLTKLGVGRRLDLLIKQLGNTKVPTEINQVMIWIWMIASF